MQRIERVIIIGACMRACVDVFLLRIECDNYRIDDAHRDHE